MPRYIAILLPCALAFTAPPATASTPQTARDKVDTSGLCSVVLSQSRPAQPTWYRWNYQRVIFHAAGVTEQDSPEERARKIQYVWDNHQPAFRCTSTDFDVREGNILKYAVSKGSYPILNDAIARWKLNLNHIDPSDNRTLLDYVANQMERNKANESYTQLERYYQLLRKTGAKLRSELP